jgi:predicted signal transduction protein with EAL and GGDEF domain
LRSFPFDKMKIDRCFISGLADGDNSRAIVQAIAGLARNLGNAGLSLQSTTPRRGDRAVVMAAGCNGLMGVGRRLSRHTGK